MQRIILLICLIYNLNCMAQEHLKFMGIPINGTIEHFQKQLETKGFKQDSEFTKSHPYTLDRMFCGNFSGCEAGIYVMCTTSNKKVYKIRVTIQNSTENNMLLRYKQMKKKLCTKYKNYKPYEGTTGEYDACIFNIKNTKGHKIGKINMVMTYSGGSYGYSLILDYIDNINERLNNLSEVNDL